MTEQTQYETPTLTLVGSFETITQGGSTGDRLDAAFPDNTPRGQLTFS